MTSPYVLIDREGWRPFVVLVLFCGIALAVSIPGAQSVRALATAPPFADAPVFFYSYVLFMGLLGLGLGGASAVRGETGMRMLTWLALRVALGQLLCLPYVAFARALYPGRGGAFALIVLYAAVTSLLLALLSRVVEQPSRGNSTVGFIAKYGVYVGYNVVPLAGVPLLSPLGAVRLLLDGIGPSETLLAFAVPVALLAVVTRIAIRLPRVTHG